MARPVFRPTVPGEWRALDLAGRQRWLDDAHDRHFASPASQRLRRTAEVVIDGEDFEDFTGFLCAIGEAVNGPGGYFGRAMMGFDDCLFGGFGLEAPCTIRWKRSARSRERLGGDFDRLVDTIRSVRHRASWPWAIELRLE